MSLLQLFLTMLYFFLFVLWIWLLITVAMDVFRSDDLDGKRKAFWLVFLLLLPYLGVFIYLISRGGEMHERELARVAAAQEAAREFVREAATVSPADELAKLAELRDRGVLTDDELAAEKAKLLG